MAPRLLVVAAVACVAVSGAAFAASLGVSSARLTSFAAASSVPTSTCSLDAAADAHVSNALLEGGSNFGNAAELHVSGGGTDKRSFVRFDVSSCVPSTAEVKSASLRLFLVDAPSSSRTYAAHGVTASWAEGSVTWDNQPGVGSSSGTVPTGTTDGVTLSWTVTSDVQSFVTGSNDGWRISDTNESGLLSSQEGRFGSSEGANGPTLEITYYP